MRARLAVAAAPVFVWGAAISALPHKEERFLYPVYPLVSPLFGCCSPFVHMSQPPLVPITRLSTVHKADWAVTSASPSQEALHSRMQARALDCVSRMISGRRGSSQRACGLSLGAGLPVRGDDAGGAACAGEGEPVLAAAAPAGARAGQAGAAPGVLRGRGAVALARGGARAQLRRAHAPVQAPAAGAAPAAFPLYLDALPLC